jgi:two-component system, sensor histidine kinase and response regulator
MAADMTFRAGPEAFDADDLLERLMGNEELARRIVSRFLADLPGQLAELKKALREADANSAAQRAHRIKGSAANVSARGVSALAAQMDQSCRSGDLAGAAALLAKLEECAALSRVPMERFCLDGEAAGSQ